MLFLKVAKSIFACAVWSQPHHDTLDLNLVTYREWGDDKFERSDHK